MARFSSHVTPLNLTLAVDISYGTGLLAFDEVCKRVETMALKTEDNLRSEHIRSQVYLSLLISL